jgi:ribosomal protein L29
MKGKASFMKELGEKTIKELVQMRKEMKKNLYELKMKNAIKGLKETHKIGDVRVKIARIQTVLVSKAKK